MNLVPRIEVFALLTTLTAVAVGCAVFAYMKKKKRRPNLKDARWNPCGKVEQLWLYPAKSCKGIPVPSFHCSKIGAADGKIRDRVLMFVDGSGNFITARTYPKLVLVEVLMDSESATFRAPSMEEIVVRLPKSNDLELSVTIWGEKLNASDCGDEISAWISRYLGVHDRTCSFRLVYHLDTKTRRQVKVKNVWPRLYQEDGAAFTDLAPFLLINDESVKDLCVRLENPDSISPRNFRPNIVISGPSAFSEDNWSFVKIGEVIFRHTKPCDRCMLTTVDPDNGKKNENQEPIRTLRQYRCTEDPKMKAAIGTSPLMGINLAAETEGLIKVGDTVKFM